MDVSVFIHYNMFGFYIAHHGLCEIVELLYIGTIVTETIENDIKCAI